MRCRPDAVRPTCAAAPRRAACAPAIPPDPAAARPGDGRALPRSAVCPTDRRCAEALPGRSLEVCFLRLATWRRLGHRARAGTIAQPVVHFTGRAATPSNAACAV